MKYKIEYVHTIELMHTPVSRFLSNKTLKKMVNMYYNLFFNAKIRVNRVSLEGMQYIVFDKLFNQLRGQFLNGKQVPHLKRLENLMVYDTTDILFRNITERFNLRQQINEVKKLQNYWKKAQQFFNCKIIFFMKKKFEVDLHMKIMLILNQFVIFKSLT